MGTVCPSFFPLGGHSVLWTSDNPSKYVRVTHCDLIFVTSALEESGNTANRLEKKFPSCGIPLCHLEIRLAHLQDSVGSLAEKLCSGSHNGAKVFPSCLHSLEILVGKRDL